MSQQTFADSSKWGELVQTYYQVTKGEGDAEKTLELFNTWQKEHPDHVLVAVYLGALHCLKARDAWAPWTKMSLVNKGVDLMDKAVENVAKKAPQDLIRARIERAFVDAELPDMFGRKDVALENLEMVVSSPEWDSLAEPLKERVQKVLAQLQSA